MSGTYSSVTLAHGLSGRGQSYAQTQSKGNTTAAYSGATPVNPFGSGVSVKPHLFAALSLRPNAAPNRVEVTRVSFRTVCFIPLDKSVSGTVPQWVFLQDFQPRDREEKAALNRPPSPTKCVIPI